MIRTGMVAIAIAAYCSPSTVSAVIGAGLYNAIARGKVRTSALFMRISEKNSSLQIQPQENPQPPAAVCADGQAADSSGKNTIIPTPKSLQICSRWSCAILFERAWERESR